MKQEYAGDRGEDQRSSGGYDGNFRHAHESVDGQFGKVRSNCQNGDEGGV